MKKKLLFIIILLILIFNPYAYASNDLNKIEYDVNVDIKNEYFNILSFDEDSLYDFRDTVNKNSNTLEDVTFTITYTFAPEGGRLLIIHVNLNYLKNVLISVEIELNDDSYFVYDNNDDKPVFMNWVYDIENYYNEEKYVKLFGSYSMTYNRRIFDFKNDMELNSLILFKGYKCFKDKTNDKIMVSKNNLLSINEIIKLLGIYDKKYNKIAIFKIYDTDYGIDLIYETKNDYYIKLYSYDKDNNLILKTIYIKLIDDELFNLNEITVSYNNKMNTYDIQKEYIDTSYDINIKSLYFDFYDVVSSYDYYAYCYIDDYLYINSNIINVIDDIKPVILPKINDFKSIDISNIEILEKPKIEEYFYIYDGYGNITIEYIGYDNYLNHFNEIGYYDITLNVIDDYENIESYDLRINVVDSNMELNELDYYINVNLSERKSILDLQQYFV